MPKPLCFTLMPFGTKSDGQKEINFNTVYYTLIRPAIEMAGLDPIRADGEQSAGFIHKPMYERLLFCDFAVADLSFANANVFYELGIRHAIREYTTICIFEIGTKLPFDVAPLRCFPYVYDKEVKDLANAVVNLSALIKANLTLSEKLEDSPIGQLVEGYQYPDLSSIRNEAIAFNDWAIQTREKKRSIRAVLGKWNDLVAKKYKGRKPSSLQEDPELQALKDEVNTLETSLGQLMFQDLEVPLTLIATYRAMAAWADVVSLIRKLPDAATSKNIYLRQQLAQALGRTGQFAEAEEILKSLIAENGPDPETNGMLGSLYMSEMEKTDNKFLKRGFQESAIKAYVEGFESDPRDFYPGINALTCMFLKGNTDEAFNRLLPVVEFAIGRKNKSSLKDTYWLKASALEIAMLRMDEDAANERAAIALGELPEIWMKESTFGNLEKITETAKALKGEEVQWMDEIKEAFRP